MTTTEPAPVTSSIEELLDRITFGSASEAEKGAKFERLTKAFLKNDVEWVAQFEDVWLWNEWPEHKGRDTGIDLVAKRRDNGEYVAIQCKFYDPQTTLQKSHIDSFLSDSGKEPFASRLVVSTVLKWGPNAEDAIKGQAKPVNRIGLTDLLESSIDWAVFDPATPEAMTLKARKELRPHQRTALDKVRAGFEQHDRGKLIMACGTGKTFTSLKIVEDRVKPGGAVLFLVPSIALLSQTLREWSLEAEATLRTFAVCSDIKVGKNEDADISVVDLAIPATTNAPHLAQRLKEKKDDAITVVFATYQSIDVVHQAQALGAPDFDLVICDEAHRTTGATLAGSEESAFVRVHDEAYLKAGKRLYMTATPRIYDDNTKAKAGDTNVILASMDDEGTFGPEFHRLGFGEAVAAGMLTDYRVLILAVDEGAVARGFQGTMAADGELDLDDVARIVGCWNGLSKHGRAEHDFGFDPSPMKRAVAFSRSIKDSKLFAAKFEAVIGDYVRNQGLNEDGDSVLDAEVRHVDGAMNILERNGHLDWLKTDPGTDACRILTNAKCLSEGVDVPALDAVMFLNPRKSVVDVVQSVGRVMRLAPGKKYGYIILPIGIPAGISPEEALKDNEKYRVVWEVLQALRAHDERFDAMVNSIDLNKTRSDMVNVIGVGTGGSGGSKDDAGAETQLSFDFAALDDWRDAIYAKLVNKVGSRRYWEDWAKDVAKIAERHRTRLLAILDSGHAADEFESFHTALKANLNEGISRGDAIDMLSQHMITKPVFDALFGEHSFAEKNPVSQVMQTMLETLEGANLESETEALDKFYESVKLRAAGIDNAQGKQRIITELYERFFKLAFPRAADALGIVYTPTEIVDFILRSVDHLSREHFGRGLSDEGVHVLDPFTGTGTFITRLLASELISPHDLARKYASEMHANEIMLLAYYIAAINIETTYQQRLLDVGQEANYETFNGIVLTDTFQMTENGDIDDLVVFTSNNARVEAQRALDIRVIVGNPPYSVGQSSGNDNNANLKYPSLDAQIEKTFAARSTAKLKNSLYDSYIRAIRWAATRIGDAGVIGFVTNGGFVDANTADGLRKTLADEFTDIYVYNLRGNQRTAGEQSRKEGGKVFGSGSRNTVAVTFLVKNPDVARDRAVVHYRDIGDYLSREQKLEIVDHAELATLEWAEITPNDAGDWTNQRSGNFEKWQSICDGSDAMFSIYSGGLKTNRDAWVYNFASTKVRDNVARMIDFYNAQTDAFATHIAASPERDAKTAVDEFIDTDPKKFSWDRADRTRLPRGTHYVANPGALRVSTYRPFCRQAVWFDRELNNTVYKMPTLYPTSEVNNHGIAVQAPGGSAPFAVLAVRGLSDNVLVGAGNPTQVLARYTFEATVGATLDLGGEVTSGYRRHDNVTDATLKKYRGWYGGQVLKDDVFAFTYGFLHSREYRDQFAADLKRSLPRIPRISTEDFPRFVDAGTRLLELHINYEDADPYPLVIDGIPEGLDEDAMYDALRVIKMAYGKSGRDKDLTTIRYSGSITVRGIPEEAHRYVLGSRSALDWIIDRYQVKTDKASGIVNDPNDWSREVNNPRYILDLLAKVTTVSVETMRIVDALPPLRIVED
ncbi:DEAD/DEAH box helicase [Demequina soli]|uniref:DEAD/DEAH box helicase n=1 Tax=Demequina soli TaxID=1638987 RepID=UPI000783A507|nr:type ISP restriction/modification enzyme [Demequina soli]